MSDSLGASMALVLFVGSARAEATEAQRFRILTEALPPLKDDALTMSEAYRTCMEKVVEIMGPSWAPNPEWQKAIDGFIGSASA